MSGINRLRAMSRFLTSETIFNRFGPVPRVGNTPVIEEETADDVMVSPSVWFENEHTIQTTNSNQNHLSRANNSCPEQKGASSATPLLVRPVVEPRVQPLVCKAEEIQSSSDGAEPISTKSKKRKSRKKRKSKDGSGNWSVTENDSENVSGDLHSPMSAELQELTRTIQRLDVTLQCHIKAITKQRIKSSTLSSKERHGIEMDTQPDYSAEKPAKRTVYIRVVFLKIGEIDTVKETFAADVFVQACWREPKLDDDSSQDGDDIEWERYWNPKLYIDNLLGEGKETLWQSISFDQIHHATVYEKRRLKGTFLENMELNSFPFDTQDLTITITSERPETEIELEEDRNDICSINVQSFVDEQEWSLHCHVDTWKRTIAHEHRNNNHRFPAICACCKARRRSGFFIWNILVVMLFICSLSFATFTVHDEKPQNRLQLSFTLVLTTIAFKFTANQSLPKISYLTYLDKYILTSMGILCGICVWHSIIPLIKDRYGLETAKTADRSALGILGSGYILFHVIFFTWIYIKSMRAQKNYERKDTEHKAKLERLKYNPDQDKRILMRKIVPMF